METIQGRTESDRIEINKINNSVTKYYNKKWENNNQLFHIKKK